MDTTLVYTAKVMAQGQITLPKDIREVLSIQAGDCVTLIHEGDRVIMMNSAVYAMETLQQAMAGEAERAGLNSESDVEVMIMAMRDEQGQ